MQAITIKSILIIPVHLVWTPGPSNQLPRLPWEGDQRNLGGPKPLSLWSKGVLLYLLVPPKSLFCPSNSIICRPPKIIVLSPQIPFLVAPQNHLSSPQNNCSVPSNSVSSRPQNHSDPSNSVFGPHFGIWRNRSSVHYHVQTAIYLTWYYNTDD